MKYAELVKALRFEADYVVAGFTSVKKTMHDAAAAIEELQAEVKRLEPKRGEWIYEDLDNFRKYKVTCPHCGAWFVGNYDAYDDPSEFLYCPHCGNICNPTNLDWENELKEREKEARAKMEVQDAATLSTC